MKTIKRLLPHVLFCLVLLAIIWPSSTYCETKWPLISVIILIEISYGINRTSRAASDITILLFIFLGAWELYTTKVQGVNTMLFPMPENVFAIFLTDWKKIIEGIGSSLWLLGIGFMIAMILGIGLGMIVGWVERLREAILPIAKIISPIPPIIYSPYAIALLPDFKSASIFVIFSSIFWNVFMNMCLSIATIDKKILDSAKTLNVKTTTMFLNILFPYSLAGILRGLNISISSSFMVLTAAEMIGATSGLGWYVKYYSDFADYTRVVAGIIVIGVVVSIINWGVAKIEKKVIRWRD